jgi:biopolymer transport protein ExbB
MVPIFVLALVCASVGLWKLCTLWRIRVSSDTQVVPFARFLFSNRKGAGEIAAKARGFLRRLFAEAFAHADEPRDQLEEVLYDRIHAEVPRLENKMHVLSVGAAVAPLLGLLGTVTGMIHTFRLITIFGSGDARLLSSGISEALITTEAGLITAIPLLFLHAVLSRRVRTIVDGLEKSVLTILNECPAPAAQKKKGT